MPRMDGLTFLKIIMEERPLPVIIMSSLSKSGSQHAIEALRLGAVDVLGKPGGSYSFGDLGPQLIGKIKAAATARLRKPAPTRTPFKKPSSTAPADAGPTAIKTAVLPATPASTAPLQTRPPMPAPRSTPAYRIAPLAKVPARAAVRASLHHPRRLILLGASTGGTEALREVLTALPGDLPGIAIVQHIPAHFSKAFADRLNTICAFEVREAVDGDKLAPGLALVAPGNFHMMLQWAGDGYRVRLSDGPMVWHQRPAVDLLFKSAADLAGAHAIAGVLTGMGKDGAEGLLRLREKGATTFAQDEATSVVYGMPKVAWENGGAQRQLALDHVADFITHAVANTPSASASTLNGGTHPAQVPA
jgi:two-component system chemotaxis response regulator CheB